MALKGEIDQDDVAVGVNALQEINKNVQESKTLYLYDYKYVFQSLLLVISYSENQTVSTVPTSTKVSFSSNLLLLTNSTRNSPENKPLTKKNRSSKNSFYLFFTQFRSQLQYI